MTTLLSSPATAKLPPRAKTFLAQAPVQAMIIKANVPEVKDILWEELIERVKHQAILTEPPSNLEKNETGPMRADLAITVKISDNLCVRINVKAQNMPPPEGTLGSQRPGTELSIEQQLKDWTSDPNYDGPCILYSIWLISNGPKWAQGRVFELTKPALEEIPLMDAKLSPANVEELAESLGIWPKKIVLVAAYLPDWDSEAACADWVRMMSTVLCP